MRTHFSIAPVAAFVTSLLTSTFLATGVSFSAAIFNPCDFTAQAARTFGHDGEDGDDGRRGRAGEPGRSATVEATGRPLNVNIEGRDGSDGEAGEHARRARCGNQGQPSHDLEAADGGDGGDGGQGGNGGNGGALTVYYQSRSDLSTVYVNAAGGKGGAGGRGGRGTEGCDCEDDEWTITTCTDGNCTTTEYECEDGDRGHNGTRGRAGADGQLGQARLIQSAEPLAADRPEATVAIADFPTTSSNASTASSPIELSRNLWQPQTGARALFAIGSIISDSYEEYAGRAEEQVQLLWEADRPNAQVSGNVQLALNEQGELQLIPDEELWIDSETIRSEALTTYRVRGALMASEATQLSLGRNRGRGHDLTMTVIDTAGTSDLVDTQFFLRYYTDEGDRRSRFVSRYDAAIPNELITQDYNRFSVALGQLPIDAQFLRSGTQVKVELTAMRSYAGNEAEQVLNWNGQL